MPKPKCECGTKTLNPRDCPFHGRVEWITRMAEKEANGVILRTKQMDKKKFNTVLREIILRMKVNDLREADASYNGEDDSGSIEEVKIYHNDGELLHSRKLDALNGLEDRIKDACYMFLHLNDIDFCHNYGGYGIFNISVDTKHATLQHNERVKKCISSTKTFKLEGGLKR